MANNTLRRSPAEAPVQLYMRESDIHQPYEVLGGVSAMDLGKYTDAGPAGCFADA